MLKYHTGCLGAPPSDATTAYRSPSVTRMSGVLRSLPVLLPLVSRMITGAPSSSVPSVPPDDSYLSTCDETHSHGLASYVPSTGMAALLDSAGAGVELGIGARPG